MTPLPIAGPRAALAAVLASLASTAVPAQPLPPSPVRSAFVITAGADTIASEQYTRDAARVASTLQLLQQGLRFDFVMTLAPNGTVPRLETTVRRLGAPADGPPLQHAVIAFTDDSVLVSMGDAAAPSQRFAAPPGTLPYVNLSAAVLEQILRRARQLGGSTVSVPLFAVSGGALLHATVHWVRPDSATVTFPNVELDALLRPEGALASASVPAQHVAFTRAEDAAPARPTAPAPPDYSAPPGAPYTAQDVSVPDPAAGIDLAGTLTIPRHARGARVPAVVMITGSGPQDRDESSPALPGWRPFRQIADTLGRRGVAVLRLDDRGVGGTPPGPPGATTADFANDIRAALAWLRARPEIDPRRVGLIGHSEGAVIAPMIAASDPTVRAIVLLAAPARTGRAVSDAQVREALEQRMHLAGAALDSAIRANDVQRDAEVAASPWLRFWFDYDPIPTATRVRCPVLIVQGATDTQVSPDQAQELAAAMRGAGNRDVTVRIMPETNHLLVHDPDGSFTHYGRLPNLVVTPAVLGTIADWVAAHMG